MKTKEQCERMCPGVNTQQSRDALRSASIVFVVPRFHTNLYFATKSLQEAGAKVSVFCAGQMAQEDHGLVEPRVFDASADRETVWRALDAAAPSLLFVRDAPPVSAHAAAYARTFRVKAFSYDQMPMTRRRKWLKLARVWARGLPVARVTPTPGLDHAAPRDRFAHYLPWPVERDPGAEIAAVPEEGPLRILCVGKLGQKRKNQHVLLDALETFPRGAVKITFVGSTDASIQGFNGAHLQALVDRANRLGWVDLVRDAPFSEMPGFYASHDVCVLPSHREPLGTAPIEAMAYGAVPVVSRECGSAGYITDGVDGFIVDMQAVDSLRSIVARLVGDRQLLRKIGAAALATAAGPLGKEAFLKRVAALLEG